MIDLNDTKEYRSIKLLEEMLTQAKDKKSYKVLLQIIDFNYNIYKKYADEFGNDDYLLSRMSSFSFTLTYSGTRKFFYPSKSAAGFYYSKTAKVNFTNTDKRRSKILDIFIDRYNANLSKSEFEESIFKYLKKINTKKIKDNLKKINIDILNDSYTEKEIIPIDSEYDEKYNNEMSNYGYTMVLREKRDIVTVDDYLLAFSKYIKGNSSILSTVEYQYTSGYCKCLNLIDMTELDINKKVNFNIINDNIFTKSLNMNANGLYDILTISFLYPHFSFDLGFLNNYLTSQEIFEKIKNTDHFNIFKDVNLIDEIYDIKDKNNLLLDEILSYLRTKKRL